MWITARDNLRRTVLADHFRFDVAARGAGRFDLLHEGNVLIGYASGGATAMLDESACSRFRIRDLARWGAPFALASLGVAFLHAATVQRDGIIVTIMGEGGAGKSTLARGFEGLGWTPVSDDMVACDEGGRVGLSSEKLLRAWCAEVERTRVPRMTLPFGGLASRVRGESAPWEPPGVMLFLGNRLGLQEAAQVTWLSPMQTFEQLAKLGFGNVPSPAAWATQTRTHAALASRAEGATLRVPDSLERLEAALPALQEELIAAVTRGAETG